MRYAAADFQLAVRATIAHDSCGESESQKFFMQTGCRSRRDAENVLRSQDSEELALAKGHERAIGDCYNCCTDIHSRTRSAWYSYKDHLEKKNTKRFSKAMKACAICSSP